MRGDYSSDVEGGAPVAVRYAILGRFDRPAYLDFVADRAAWLDIRGWVAESDDGVTLVAAGPESLVGALEMACTLGPGDALVDSIIGRPTAEPIEAGFRVRASGMSSGNVQNERGRFAS